MKLTVQQIEYNADVHKIFIDRLKPEYDLIGALKDKKVLLGEVMVGDDVILGIFIFRIETMLDKTKQLVICNVVSDKTSVNNFTGLTLPFVKQMAIQNKIKSIRLHTDEKGIEKLAEKYGFKFYETILITEV